MGIEVGELIRQDVRVRYDIKLLLAELLLHLHHVRTASVLPSELTRVRKMVDLLVFVQVLPHEGLQRLARPKNVPVVAFRLSEATRLIDRLDELGVSLDHLVEEFVLVLLL